MSSFGTHPSELLPSIVPKPKSFWERVFPRRPTREWKTYSEMIMEHKPVGYWNEEENDWLFYDDILELRDAEDGDNLLHLTLRVFGEYEGFAMKETHGLYTIPYGEYKFDHAKLQNEIDNERAATILNINCLSNLINEPNKFGVTPVMLAASMGVPVLKVLEQASEKNPNEKTVDTEYHKNVMGWALDEPTLKLLQNWKSGAAPKRRKSATFGVLDQ